MGIDNGCRHKFRRRSLPVVAAYHSAAEERKISAFSDTIWFANIWMENARWMPERGFIECSSGLNHSLEQCHRDHSSVAHCLAMCSAKLTESVPPHGLPNSGRDRVEGGRAAKILP